MRFGILGPVEVRTERGALVRVPELKVRTLLAHLLAHRGETVPADRLVEDLWSARQPANPRGALQARVSQLRRALDDAEPGARELVASQPPGYRLDAPAGAVDAGRFADALTRARAEPDPRTRATLLGDALALWRGPAFADVADALFARPVAAHLDELRLAAVEERAESLLETGEHAPLVGELEELVTRHPLRERLRAAQMRALYLAGRPSDALDSYRDLRTRLRDELGTDPGPDLVALHRAVLAHDPALRRSRPRLGSAPPAALGPLVGRDDDIERVAARLRTERLVTLVGPGGVGKTRLALAVAHRLHPQLADGSRFVALDGLATSGRAAAMPELAAVADVVGAAYGTRAGTGPGHTPPPGEDPVTRLAESVRGRRGLLVLDNCEHVAGAAAAVAARLLAAAAELRVLATSREPLELPGEALHVVDPLPADGPASPAVALFAERAAAADPGFVLDPDSAHSAVAVCRRLDGIPLALELAAARVRALGLPTLLDRLDDRFTVLAGGRRGSPARQQTLRATLDWSWELLDEAERTVLRRMAVFAGGCTLDAAEVVCGPGTSGPDVVAHLVDRSLVVRQGERYRMLDSVAAYAAERLAEAGEAPDVRARHLRHHLALAERAAPRLRGPQQGSWLARLDAESANLRAALDHAVASDDAAAALRLVDALAWYWFLRGRPGEGVRAATAALAVAPGEPDGPREAVRVWRAALLRWTGAERTEPDPVAGPARVRWFLAFTGWDAGRSSGALRRVDGLVRAFRAAADRWGEAAALATRASHRLIRDDLPAARRDAERADALFTELGDGWGRLQALETLATVAEATGAYPDAARRHAAALHIAEDLELWPEISGQLSGLGRIALLTGDLDDADAHLERALRLATELGNAELVSYAEFGLAISARRRGDLDRTEQLLARWAGERGFAALTPLAELGFVAELRGDGERALALHRAGYREALAHGGPRAVAVALEGMAGAWSLLGEHARAARLLGAADGTRRAAGAPLPPAERGDVDRIVARTRAGLGGVAFDRAFAQGAAADARALA